MRLRSIPLKPAFQTIDWLGDAVVDWSKAGMVCSLSGETRQTQKFHFGHGFDRAVSTPDGVYAFIYQESGTKGLLLKHGELLREINRSYYHASDFEYPVRFWNKDGKAYLIHCPNGYSRLEIEEVESGKFVTECTERKTVDIFHSRLETSPNGELLLSKGWIWHPTDVIRLFKVGDCIADPRLLDAEDAIEPDAGREINTAGFVNDREVLIGTNEGEVFDYDAPEIMPAKSFAIWDVVAGTLSKPITPRYPFGNLIPIRDRLAWDIFGYPKIIEIDTGEIIVKDETIDSGKRNSSIIHHIEHGTRVAFNTSRTMVAIQGTGGAVTVLAIEE